MNILTIKFNPTAVKTYDYLLINPKGLTLNSKQPLKIITGSKTCKEVFVINNTKMDRVPHWVTSQMVLHDNNECMVEHINCVSPKVVTPQVVHSSVTKTEQICKSVPIKEPKSKIPMASGSALQSILDTLRIDSATMQSISRLNRA